MPSCPAVSWLFSSPMANRSARAAASLCSDVRSRRELSLRMSDRCRSSSSLTGHCIRHHSTGMGFRRRATCPHYSGEFSMDRFVSFRGIVLCKAPALLLAPPQNTGKTSSWKSRNCKAPAGSYSDFNIVFGSISAARSAGRQAAANATAGSAITAPAKVKGSNAEIP